jgi:hypothetical protein
MYHMSFHHAQIHANTYQHELIITDPAGQYHDRVEPVSPELLPDEPPF